MTDSVRETVTVRSDPGTILAIVADVERYPEWQPEISSVEVLQRDAEGRPSQARFVIDVKVMTVTCTLAYTYDEAGMHWHLVDGDGLTRNDGSYLLEEVPDGGTQLTYELLVEPAMPVPGMIRRQIAKRIVDGALSSVKERAEAA